jgi:hypothetical protein
MKKQFTFLLIMISIISNAQSLSGTQNFSGNGGGPHYTVINWRVNYRIYEENGFYYISLNNPSASVANNSQYNYNGVIYNKSDLGLSVWPDSEPRKAITTLSLTLTVQYPGGSISTAVGAGNHEEAMIAEPNNKFSKTYNLSISSFKVSSVQSMRYNGGRDGVLDRLIEEKKNKSSTNNSTQSSNNPATQSGRTTSNTSTTNSSNSYELKLSDIGISDSNSSNNPQGNYNSASGLYSNPLTSYSSSSSAVSEFQKNYETGQQIANTAVAIFDLFSPSPEELARRERAENLRIEREEEATRVRAEKVRLISSRKALIANYPDGKTPLSFQAKEVSEVYFFAYSHTPSEIENSPMIYISDVFSSEKYGDGTWQFKTSLVDKISKQNNGMSLILCGFYLSKSEAEKKQSSFLYTAKNSGFHVRDLKNTVAKSSSNSSNDAGFWGNENQPTQKTTEPKNDDTDFWGNSISNTPKKEVKNEVPKTETPQVSKKVKLDFWGNPIKD